MTDAIRIIREPTGIDHALAIVLVGLTVRVQLPDNPDARFIWIDNNAIRQAIATATIGAERAEGFYPLLPLDRATRIPRDCCHEIEHRFAPSND
ncbi:MAG: hypothetical protein WBO92_04215 [Candidatus Moraniibacteriota bacterium]